MSGRIRAKFRCLSITKKWDTSYVIKLGPVMKNGTSEHFEENKKFWDATPTGECKLTYQGAHPFEIGAYYYIDMDARETPRKGVTPSTTEWQLGTVSRHTSGGELTLWGRTKYDWQGPKPVGVVLEGNLTLGIGSHEVVDLFGKPGGIWDVQFTFAEKSDR